jgi:hypothetical protein
MADGGMAGGGMPQHDVYQEYMDYLNKNLPSGGSAPVTPFKYATPEEIAKPTTTTTTSTATPEYLPQQSGGHGISQEQRDEKNDPNSWQNQTPEQKIAYYANPNSTIFGIPALSLTEGAQNLWNGSMLGRLQNYFDPSIQGGERDLTAAARMRMALQNAPVQNLSEVTRNPFDTGRGDVSAPTPTPIAAPATDNSSNPISGYSIGPASDNSGGRSDASGLGGTSYGSVAAGYGGGSEAANGGLMESHYARGGNAQSALRPPHPFFSQATGKYEFHPAKMYAEGGISDMYNLGSYSDGGRLLRGPGDGVSDSIPATIGHKQPARLADGEFVVPARIVSEIGNGSTEAGARKLYAMMDRVQKARGNTMGKGKVAKNSRAERYLPA